MAMAQEICYLDPLKYTYQNKTSYAPEFTAALYRWIKASLQAQSAIGYIYYVTCAKISIKNFDAKFQWFLCSVEYKIFLKCSSKTIPPTDFKIGRNVHYCVLEGVVLKAYSLISYRGRSQKFQNLNFLHLFVAFLQKIHFPKGI